MKKLILTGLGTEQRFDSVTHGKIDLSPICYLIFNEGELRVPISEEAAEIVIREMLQNSSDDSNESDYQDHDTDQDWSPDYDGGTDEAGVDQV